MKQLTTQEAMFQSARARGGARRGLREDELADTIVSIRARPRGRATGTSQLFQVENVKEQVSRTLAIRSNGSGLIWRLLSEVHAVSRDGSFADSAGQG